MTVPLESDICPRCEDGILVATTSAQDITVSDSVIRVPNVQVDECRNCGFRAISGRNVGLFDLLFAPQYSRIQDLVAALRTAGYLGMFLQEHRSESSLGFGSREYVANLQDDLRDLYLDNESNHVIRRLSAARMGLISLDLQGQRLNVKIPKIGEGENGVVFDFEESPGSVLKIAKPRQYSRNHLVEEFYATDFFEKNGVPVPRIEQSDPFGNFMIKQKLAGDSLAKVYYDLGGPESPVYKAVKTSVKAFVDCMLELFVKYPEWKTSVSPNNIFVLISGTECRCLLVDTGPAPFHDYSTFNFEDYWHTVIPQKIKQYRAVGYL